MIRLPRKGMQRMLMRRRKRMMMMMRMRRLGMMRGMVRVILTMRILMMMRMMMRRRKPGWQAVGGSDRRCVFWHHFRRTASWRVPTRERLLSRLRVTGAMTMMRKSETEATAAAAAAYDAGHVADIAAAIAMMLHDGARVGVVEFPHVLLEIKVAAKTFATESARERLLVVVSVHVERQIVDLYFRD